MSKISTFVIISFLTAISSTSLAQIDRPARTIEEVTDSASIQKTLKVTTARVVIADYDLLRRDFPSLRTINNSQIDNWLLENFSYISKQQAEQQIANTHIQTSIESTAYRPPDYNRALVFAISEGLVDGKGFGTLSPRPGGHSDGCATLGEAIREYLYEKLVQRVFDDSGSGLKTVGSYAVLDWGFRVKHLDGTESPAGAILRQAHKRYHGNVSSFDDTRTKNIEMVLRRYGLTSAGAYRISSGADRLNLQGTESGDVIDFGGFLVIREFSKPAFAFYGFDPLLVPGTSDFVQPDPIRRVPFDIWGTTVSGVEDPKLDNVWIWSHELASAFANGSANRYDVWAHFENLMKPVEMRLSGAPPRCATLLSDH